MELDGSLYYDLHCTVWTFKIDQGQVVRVRVVRELDCQTYVVSVHFSAQVPVQPPSLRQPAALTVC